jgi:heterodisulfide reductase subunit A-like polyferredoxin
MKANRMADLMCENRVVELLREWLPKNGYAIKSYKHNTQPGHDIEATKNGVSFYIECKGSQSNANGNEFSKNSKFNCAASAFFNQMRIRESEPESEVGIAFPDDEYYCGLMQKLEALCKKNSVRVLWVSENSVSEW